MNNSNVTRSLILCGDIHGEFKTLVWKAVSKYKISNADIVVLGDFGVGFDNRIKSDYEHVEKKLEKNDITVYAIRGNHDDPKWFVDGTYNFPRLKFLKDYELITLGDGYKILPIGGANSIDVEYRIKENAKLAPNRSCWWEGEDIERIDLKYIPKRVDLVLSHECPLIFSPIPTRPAECPLWQYNKILSSREYLKEVALNVNSSYWFYGHYHKSMSGEYKETIWRCLDIMEFYEVPEKKLTNPQGSVESDEVASQE